MPTVKVIVRSKKDESPALPSLNNPVKVELESFVILEGGMASGKNTVTFHFKLADGTDALATTSAEIFKSMAGALKGAEDRFAIVAAQNPNQINIHDAIRDADAGGD